MIKDDYPGDQTITNLTLNIFSDDDLCKNRLHMEIKIYQEKLQTGKVNFTDL